MEKKESDVKKPHEMHNSELVSKLMGNLINLVKHFLA